jgi:hypothetical protein
MRCWSRLLLVTRSIQKGRSLVCLCESRMSLFVLMLLLMLCLFVGLYLRLFGCCRAGFFALIGLGFLSAYTIKLLSFVERQFVTEQSEERMYMKVPDSHEPASDGSLTASQPRLPTYYTMGRDTFGTKVGRSYDFFALFIWFPRLVQVGIFIWLGIVLTILGVCGVYLDFIGAELSGLTNGALSQTQVTLLAAIPLVFLSWLRSLKYVILVASGWLLCC